VLECIRPYVLEKKRLFVSMRMCGGNQKTPKGSREDQDKSQSIDNILLEDKKNSSVKLLLLGAGESGKSTFAKQIKILHLDGFSDEDRQSFKSIIYNNIMGSIRVLVDAAITMNIDIQVGNRDAAKRVMDEVNFQGQITEQMAKDIKGLWQDKGIQIAFQRSSEFQLNDSAEYYFVELDRIAHPNYMPSVQDILRSRAKTTGIIETEFKIGKQKFTLTDVGGQRSERRKWMHCFQDVTAVIFFSSLAEYDLKLYEDESTNRMHESLKLFKDICNTKWFIDTNIILFLNKKDLFEKKSREYHCQYASRITKVQIPLTRLLNILKINS